VDGLADPAGLTAWLGPMRPLLPAGVRSIDIKRVSDFRELRSAVRDALDAALDARPVPRAAITKLNRTSALARSWLELNRRGDAVLRSDSWNATDALLAAIAADAVALVGGDDAAGLRRCRAPGCVLVFLKDHPRRQWCSYACGNRARQARHYARTHS
jgi:predicted RNA-binding Zn ribbon-like protein